MLKDDSVLDFFRKILYNNLIEPKHFHKKVTVMEENNIAKSMIENFIKEPCPHELRVFSSSIKKGSEVKAHYHNHIEFLYCLDGTLYVNCDGEEYHLRKNEFLIINSEVIHCTRAEENTSYMCFKASPSVLYKATKRILRENYFLPFFVKNEIYQIYFKADIMEESPVCEILSHMVKESKAMEYGYELLMLSDTYRLFAWILRYWQSQGHSMAESITKEEFEAHERIKDYIRKNYRDNISAKELSKYCNMSYSSFYSFFKKTMGSNFTDYVARIRISEAEKLLATSTMPISQISSEVGFATPSYFVAQFKKSKKITPKQFRMQYDVIV